MKVLFIGDVYGSRGMKALEILLPEIKATYKPHIIIVNGENAANGRGINKKIYTQMMSMGIHAVTMGNWVWGNQELFSFIEESNIVRPLNFPKAPGQGYLMLNFNHQKVLIINALGRTFMNPNLDDPFKAIEQLIAREKADYVIVDFHAEATSEKVALGHYLDGKVNLLVGTHTHIPTADERKLPQGTLYITDVGMTGPVNGVIGVSKEIVIERFLNGFARPNEVALGAIQMNAVLADLTAKTIQRIHFKIFHKSE
mgnify:CR=1 FL=1